MFTTKEYYFALTEKDFTASLKLEEYNFLKTTFFLPVEIRGNSTFKK